MTRVYFHYSNTKEFSSIDAAPRDDLAPGPRWCDPRRAILHQRALPWGFAWPGPACRRGDELFVMPFTFALTRPD